MGLYHFTFIIWCRENEARLLTVWKQWERWVEEHGSCMRINIRLWNNMLVQQFWDVHYWLQVFVLWMVA